MGCRRNHFHIYDNRDDEYNFCSKCSSYCCTCIEYTSPVKTKSRSSNYSAPRYLHRSSPISLVSATLSSPSSELNALNYYQFQHMPIRRCSPPLDLEVITYEDSPKYRRQSSVITSPARKCWTSGESETNSSSDELDSSPMYCSTSSSSLRSSPTCTLSSPSKEKSPTVYRRLNFIGEYSPLSPASPTLEYTNADFIYSPYYKPTAFDYYSPASPMSLEKSYIDSSPEDSPPKYMTSSRSVTDVRPNSLTFMDHSPISPKYRSLSSPSLSPFSSRYASTSPDYSPTFLKNKNLLPLDVPSPRYRYDSLDFLSPTCNPSDYSLSFSENYSPVMNKLSKSSLKYLPESPVYSSACYCLDSPTCNGNIQYDDIPCICCSPLPARY